MKFTFIKTNQKEEVVVYGKEKNNLIFEIEKLCLKNPLPLIGYFNETFKELDTSKVECFITLNDKVYALYENKKYHIKMRLYEINEMYLNTFTYVNQSCLANLKMVDHFDVSFGGTIQIIFKCGYKDYVSRRQIKHVKERMGLI